MSTADSRFDVDVGGALYRLVVAATVLFAVGPLVIIAVVSLTPEQFLAFPPRGFSTQWYAEFFRSGDYLASTRTSFVIAFGAAAIAGVFGTLAAFALDRTDPPGKAFLYGLFGSPILLPPIILAVGFLNLFASVGMTGTYPAVMISHAVFAIPFPFILVTTALMEIDGELEEASQNLGAGRVRTFRRVTFPLIQANVAAGFIFAFVMSINEFIIAQLLSGFTLSTLPIRIFSSLRYSMSPLIASTSVLIIVVTAALVVLINRLSGGLWE